MYSRSHCLTRIPKKAEDRLATRLINQSEFTQMAAVDGLKNCGCVGSKEVVELTWRVASWDEIAVRRSTVVWELSTCNREYDRTTKAVSTAENKPAYKFESKS